jgi:hypothetical protein
MSIDQRGQSGLHLAGSGESMGMRTMLVEAQSMQNYGGEISRISQYRGVMGNSGIQLLVDKRLRVPVTNNTYGRVYVNNNIFAFRNILNGNNP